MDWWNVAWEAVNSPIGITVLAAVALWVLNLIYAKKPEWQKYEGTIIAAIKAAEKAIPDDTTNTSAARFDKALKLVLAVVEKNTGTDASANVIASVSEGISIVHAELESAGNLEPKE